MIKTHLKKQKNKNNNKKTTTIECTGTTEREINENNKPAKKQLQS